MITQNEFSPPHNWCDGRCQRCPIGDCQERSRLAQRGWGHQMRAEAPDAAEIRLEDVLRDFRRVMNPITDNAERERLGHDAPVHRPRFVALDARRLSDVACRLFGVVHDAVRASPSSNSEELLVLVSLLRIKAAQLPASGSDSKDALPNLLLLDATERQLRQALRSLRGTVNEQTWSLIEDCRAKFQQALTEQLSSGVEARRQLTRLIGQRKAPSPFCTV